MKQVSGIRWHFAQWLELLWWKRYLRTQQPAAYLARKAAYWERVLEETGVKPHAGDRVLDAGCGPAGIFMVLKNHEVDACDPLLSQYGAHLAHFNPSEYPWVRFFTRSLEDGVPHPPYDLIYCMNAINHVRDLPMVLEVLAAALKPGGRILLTTDAHRFEYVKVIFQWLPGDALHPQQFSKAEYLRFIVDAGFSIQHTKVLKPGHVFDYVAIEALKV